MCVCGWGAAEGVVVSPILICHLQYVLCVDCFYGYDENFQVNQEVILSVIISGAT